MFEISERNQEHRIDGFKKFGLWEIICNEHGEK